ncbi:MAG: xanthine dehydrogenase family protein molybdopterin-binding subunit [Phycisphaerales bacterium]|nr:MAG: xanthine dehydrogenase family protein molybdopterin-binding subunit [Phycisphaerales bacterium]
MKEDEYIELDFSDITTDPNLTRREFLRLIGGGIIIFFSIGDGSTVEGRRRGRGYPEDFNAYLRIGADGRVTCFTGKIEMGQGVVTSLAQMLADEIDVSLQSVDMVMGDTTLCPWDMGTFGSMTTRFFGPALRAAGAEARAVLIELAAEFLQTPAERLATENGAVFDKKNKAKQVSYAQLAKGKTIARRAKGKPALKKPSEFKIVGRDVLRRDALEKVTGAAKFAGDIRLPDMLYAKILRPPAHGAKMRSVDTSAVEDVDGARLIRDGDLIAVLHKSPDGAEKALEKIKAEFDVPQATVDDETIFEHLLSSAQRRNVVASGGNIESGEKLADIRIEQTYLDGYVAHAPMETHTALAKVDGNKATVWASTQTPFSLKDQVAEALGFAQQDVRVITPFVGGGFGGKTSGRQAIEAARLAKLASKPVQVAWSREEEFFYDTFRPAAVVKIRSGVTKAGKIVFWDYGVYSAGERGSAQFYDIPHHITASFGGWMGGSGSVHPFATGPWRAPANNTNTFARESQIDIMASKAAMDPVEFRLKNLRDERMISALKAAAEEFGWTRSKAPSGRGLGVACGTDSGTCVALIAEVAVDKASGHVQVKRVVCGQEMGLVINPEGARIQMEGCITMGLGYALSEDIHFEGGKIVDVNFDTYELPRFSWVPKIETVLVEAQGTSPQGGGEPAIICMGAVIANAIFDATGARLLQLPMNPKRTKQALTSGTHDVQNLAHA